MRQLLATCLSFVVLTMPVCLPSSRATDEAGVLYRHAVVAADHPLASEIGVKIHQRGGNVVDSAVAVSFALSVVRPYASGIGGGGFMVIWNAETQEAIAIDYRETAPAAATSDLFTKGDPPPSSTRGGAAVAVPGNIAGLCLIQEKYGSLPLKDVLQPVVELASRGFEQDEETRGVNAALAARFRQQPQLQRRYAALWRHYLSRGDEDEPQPSPQADVLRRIAEQGPAGFYEGAVADDIVAAVRAAGGIIDHADLRNTRSVIRQPVRATYGGREVITMPPPSSGGVALIETLNILGAIADRNPLSSRPASEADADYYHTLTESMKQAFADRAKYLGDPDFVDVPVEALTSRARARQAAAMFNPASTHPPEAYGDLALADDGGTSHFSIIDADGNAVACTETINLTYGSYVVTPRFGIVLNNEMDDFTARPGEPNAFGLIQSAANAVEPGKKPLSSMTPAIVVRDGKAELAVGASGGPRIITATTQTLLNATRFGMAPQDATAAPRMHHQWMPDVLQMERPLGRRLGEALQQRGHEVEIGPVGSACQIAVRQQHGLQGGSDPRKHADAVRGY